MALRQEDIQVNVAFITDESRQLARTLETTKAYNRELEKSKAKIAEYQNELSQANITEQRRAQLLAKVAEEEKKVATNLGAIASEGKKVQALDLTKVTPAQLVERAKQLALAMRQIPQSAPQFKELEGELSRVNTRLRELNASAKGIQAEGAASGGPGGGFFGTITGRVTVAIAAVQAFFGAVQGVFRFISTSFAAADEAAKQDEALKSRIISTNNAARKSFEDLVEQAEALADVTLFDDDQIERAQEVLLTFTNIRDEVFEETIPTLLDLSTTMKQDVNTSAIQVGKALNDPIKGLQSLTRIGVTFSEEQKKVIKTLVDTGDVAGAQRVILEELRREFGGAAQAAAQAGAGGFQQLQKRFSEMKETLGAGLIGLLDRLSPVINFVVGKFEALASAISRAFSIPVSEKLREQQREFNSLIGVLQNVNASEETRKRAIEELQLKYPDYIGNIDLHKATESQLNEIMQSGNNLFAQRIFLKSKEERLTDLERRRNDLQKNLFEAEKRLEQAQQRTDTGFTLGLKKEQEVDKFSNLVSAYTKQLDNLNKEQNAFLQEQEQFAQRFNLFPGGVPPTAPAKTDDNTETTTKISGKFEKEAEAAKGSVAALRKEISDLQKQIENTPGDSKALVPLIVQLKLAEATLKILEERIERLKNPTVETPPSDEEIQRQLGLPTAEQLEELTEEQRVVITELNNFRIEEEQLTTEEVNRLRDGLSDEDAARRQREREELEAQAAFKKDIQNAEQALIQDAVAFGIDLLGKDESARKKYAAALKAFKISEVITSGIMEIQRIYAKYALVPGGPALAQAEVIPAIIRSSIAVGRIAVQKFARGGFTGSGSGLPDETGFRPAGIVHEGEYVVPKRIVQDRRMSPVLQMLESRRLRGYATGGFVMPDTTPVGVSSAAPSTPVVIEQIATLDAAVKRFEKVVAEFPTEVKSRVVYTEIETAGTELNAVRDDAAI